MYVFEVYKKGGSFLPVCLLVDTSGRGGGINLEIVKGHISNRKEAKIVFMKNNNVKASSEYISHFSTATYFAPLRRRHTMSRPFASFKRSESVFPV